MILWVKAIFHDFTPVILERENQILQPSKEN